MRNGIGIGKIIRKPKELRIIGWADSDNVKAVDRKEYQGTYAL